MAKVATKLRKLLFCLALSLTLCAGFAQGSVLTVQASSLEDNVGSGGSGGGSGSLEIGDLPERDADFVDALGGMDLGPKGSDLTKAANTLSPVTNILGTLVGAGIVLLWAFIFVITILDLLYITIPPIRNVLYKGGGAGAQGGMGMGGMGMRGGMMGGGMGSGNADLKPTQWISDEAVNCVALLGGGGQSGAGGGMGMGGYGMGGMGGMGGGAQQAQPMKSVIGTYFKKRVVFMVMLGICTIVLTSSIIMKTGINLGSWVLKIFNMFNNNLPM